MNKRRRYKAKRRRAHTKRIRQFHSLDGNIWHRTIPYTQIDQSTSEWLGFKRVE